MRYTERTFGAVVAIAVGASLVSVGQQGGARAQDAPGDRAVLSEPLGNALPADDRAAAARLLQDELAAFIDLHLKAKQLHWNVVGPRFRPLHEQFDEIAEEAQEATDLLAERMLALGVSPDGRAVAVGQASRLPEVPTGLVPDARTVDSAVQLLEAVSAGLYRHIEELGPIDPVSQDLLMELAHQVDKQLWMLEAQQVQGGAK